jgi:uncharacterized protein (TIGR00251 family)
VGISGEELLKNCPAWIQSKGDGVDLLIYVQAGAKTTGFSGEHGERLKLKVKAPPVDGKANEMILTFVAQELKVPKHSVSVVQGEASKYKMIHVREVDLQNVLERLGANT